VKTLTLEEAVAGLGKWLELAVAGEDIRIRKGDAVVELRPLRERGQTSSLEKVSPREALRRLQSETPLSPHEAKRYLQELHEERLAAEMHRPV
jgi:antitoxin (DNA-binding transcriptional repressor) of toxin-antitoxin stability system